MNDSEHVAAPEIEPKSADLTRHLTTVLTELRRLEKVQLDQPAKRHLKRAEAAARRAMDLATELPTGRAPAAPAATAAEGAGKT